MRDILGWKPWTEGDDQVYNGRCQCKLYVATVLALPCGDACLCRACYEVYKKQPALLDRCPRCSELATSYEVCDDPDDFGPPSVPEKMLVVEAEEEDFEFTD